MLSNDTSDTGASNASLKSSPMYRLYESADVPPASRGCSLLECGEEEDGKAVEDADWMDSGWVGRVAVHPPKSSNGVLLILGYKREVMPTYTQIKWTKNNKRIRKAPPNKLSVKTPNMVSWAMPRLQ
eukprot:Lithocolla_globosa_v1_NODE_5159_length_1291_cov_5.279126.p2 type:complete len:127 gc:universal NODE_5159_length_1291_cov_5.279126:1167-787(-)